MHVFQGTSCVCVVVGFLRGASKNVFERYSLLIGVVSYTDCFKSRGFCSVLVGNLLNCSAPYYLPYYSAYLSFSFFFFNPRLLKCVFCAFYVHHKYLCCNFLAFGVMFGCLVSEQPDLCFVFHSTFKL